MDFSFLSPEAYIILIKLLAALFIVIIAFTLSYLLQLPLKRIVKATDGRRGAGSIVKNTIRIFVWGWAICEIVNIVFGVDVAGIVGALGIVGIAVSLGAQQTIANIIGGVIISLSGMLGPGDWITIAGHSEARVVDTNWRCTTLEDEFGIEHIVPNSLMVSSIIEKGLGYFTIVIPFSLKVDTPDVEGLLVECEQVLLDRMIDKGVDFEQMRPKANIAGTSLNAIQAEVKLYPNRTYDSRSVKRMVLPALIELLQKRNVLAKIEPAETER